jgi:hypothetical protein
MNNFRSSSRAPQRRQMVAGLKAARALQAAPVTNYEDEDADANGDENSAPAPNAANQDPTSTLSIGPASQAPQSGRMPSTSDGSPPSAETSQNDEDDAFSATREHAAAQQRLTDFTADGEPYLQHFGDVFKLTPTVRGPRYLRTADPEEKQQGLDWLNQRAQFQDDVNRLKPAAQYEQQLAEMRRAKDGSGPADDYNVSANESDGDSSRSSEAEVPEAKTQSDDEALQTVWHGRFDENGNRIWDVVRDDPNHGLKTPDNPNKNYQSYGSGDDPIAMGVDVDGAKNAYAPHHLIGQFGGYDKQGKQVTQTITEPLPGFHPLDNASNGYARRTGAIVGFEPGSQKGINIWSNMNQKDPKDRAPTSAPNPDLVPRQQSGDYKGYLISTTGYEGPNKQYVDAAHVNYILSQGKAQPGDLVLVHDLVTDQTSGAIVGDSGNKDAQEGSLALHQDLGNHHATARSTENGNDSSSNPDRRFVYRVYEGSRNHKQFWSNPTQANVTDMANKMNADIDFSADQAIFDAKNPKTAEAHGRGKS